MNFRPLLLAGGLSSRMGTRKELLRFPNGDLMCVHLLRILRDACPESDVVYLSLRDPSALGDLLDKGQFIVQGPQNDTLVVTHGDSSFTVRVIYDIKAGQAVDNMQNVADIGPAAGLLAAYNVDPTAMWLVAACDFPLLSNATLLQLRESFSGAITCFKNQEGFCEPLLGIWSAQALQNLEDHVKKGILGPKSVVKQLQGQTISPHDEQWLFNANTKEEWNLALELKAKTYHI